MKGTTVVFLAALLLFTHVHAGRSSKGGVAEFSPLCFEAGSVGYGDRLMARAGIKNIGNATLHIENVRSNCSCYKASLSRKSLQPGESADLLFDLTFPKDKTPRNAFFYVLSDDVKQRLRVFVVKLSVNKDPTFCVARPKELVLQSSDKQKQDAATLEKLNSRFGVVEVQERSVAGDRKQYALRFDDGVDLEAIAKEYVKHPAVGLVFLRASETKASVSDRETAVASQQLPKALIPHSAARRRVNPLSVYWFYSEGCAFCDDVRNLLVWQSDRQGIRGEFFILRAKDLCRPSKSSFLRGWPFGRRVLA